MKESVKGQCQYCGHYNQFDVKLSGDSFFCTNCGKKCTCEEIPCADNNRLKIELSDLEDLPHSAVSGEKLVIDLSPHIKSSPCTTTKTESSSRSSFSDLRNQVTVVLPGKQTIIADEASPVGPSTPAGQVSFELPFMAGNFLATEILAKGGMSITYLGHRGDNPNEKVVIKVPDLKSSKTVTMFANECKILAELAHPNIVPIIDFGEIDADGNSFPYMVMKYIDGQSLRQKLKVQGKFSWDEASLVLNNIASALDYLYQNNFCHRDIKPDNIIFDTQSEQWILVDFGIAKSLQDNLMLTMTMAGQDSGTWDYMPPEQLDGRAVDIRCDIYALGTVIWEILIGTVPRRGTKLPAAYGIDVSSDVDVLIGKMVEHNLEDRYQTPQEILTALQSGAQRIETWKKTKSTVRKVVKYTSITLGTILLLTIIWFIGEFVAIAKAKEIYERNKSSATITVRELSKFSNKMPFFWGKRYVSSVMPDLHKRSETEEKEMKSEFASIESSIKIHSGSDEEIKTRQISCENFIAKWQTSFPASQEMSVAKQNDEALRKILLLRKEKKLLQETIAKIKKSTESKKQEHYRAAFDECRRLKSSLTLLETKRELDDFIKTLRKEAIGDALVKVDALIASTSKEDWISAYNKITSIRETLGDDPLLLEKQGIIDDRFWEYYKGEAEKALRANRFANARAYILTYTRSGMTKHKSDAEKYQFKINDAEERYNWDETKRIAEQYMKDNAFIPALDTLNRFAQKYPNTQIVDIAAQRKIIADSFISYIIQQRTDLDSYKENMDVFLQRFPEEKKSIEKLQRNLCWAIWKEIENIMFGNSAAKTELLAQIKYTKCSDSQKIYLNSLKKLAIDSAAAPKSKFKWYAFYYRYERPPMDCIPIKQRRVFWITITDFSYQLSSSDYYAYKGIFDADIQVKIQENTDNYPWKITAPVNSQEWSVSSYNGKKISFWFDTTGAPLSAGIEDLDVLERGPQRLVDFGASQFSKSGSSSYTFESGTKISIQWTTE